MADKTDFSALRAQALNAGQDEAVTVNTRALIDKVLARYSGDWYVSDIFLVSLVLNFDRTVFRELLQNAADAAAGKVTIRFETIPSSTIPAPQTLDTLVLLKHTILHHTLRRVVIANDGQVFGANDWSRLKRIAEGNPDETKIGAFGVGFYSVFADCEEPLIRSGDTAMAFFWKGNQLFTRMLPLSADQRSSDTTFVLDYRSSTAAVPDLLALSQFFASSLTFIGLNQIELWLDDIRVLKLSKLKAPSVNVAIPQSLEVTTTEGLMLIESVRRETAQIEATWLNILAWKPSITKAMKVSQSHSVTVASGTSIRSFFNKLASNNSKPAVIKTAGQEEMSQDSVAEDLGKEQKAVIFLHIDTATVRTMIDTAFARELERATKKQPPKTTTVAVLTSSFDERALSCLAKESSDFSNVIFMNVLPLKSGRVFIGFPTQQTTGLNAHISAQSIIPTVERESIDLNARYIRTWNSELLRAAGILGRIAWSRDLLKAKIARLTNEGKKTKLRHDDMETVLPECVHLLNQFTFQESTPSSQVGALIEESFWTSSQTSIEIPSTHGVQASRDVRIANEDLSFMEGIPMVPPRLQQQASAFISRLINYQIITEITTADIRRELESQALSSRHLREFICWITHKARINEIDSTAARWLLDAAVANDNDDLSQGRLIVLSEIRHFVNPTRIPATLPVPPNTIPSKYTGELRKAELEILGWEDLQIVPWLRWLVENSGPCGTLSEEYDLTRSAPFATQILPVLSKQWDGLSPSSKSTVVELLNPRTVIPTKMGMTKPPDAYFPSVKVLDNLPVVSNLHSVKDKFLVALGVRKTVDLGLIFDRLFAPPVLQQDNPNIRSSWSHVDLIKYLASVRQDIPATDIKRLKDTRTCPAEAEIPTKATAQRFRVDELFEPTEILRSLGLRLLHWPGTFRSGSDEGKFLTHLGLRAFPSVKELIAVAVDAVKSGNLVLRDRALKYMVERYYQNSYVAQESVASTIPYLPLQGGDPSHMALPSQCFTNENATIMGFPLLRNDLRSHAAKFGVQANPPILECVQRLVKNPPETKHRAREVFEYFASRLNELNGLPLNTLDDANIVPVQPSSTAPSERRWLPPRLCFLGDGGRYNGILDYVDFGTTANTFLLRCGSKYEPSASELAQLIIREPARVFTAFDDTEKYLELLRSLALSWSKLKKDSALVKDMKKVRFLLAYREASGERGHKTDQSVASTNADTFIDEDKIGMRTYELASASQIIIIDDVIEYNLFKTNVLAAPMEEELEDFYKALGAIPLSSIVEQFARLGPVLEDQTTAMKLQKLVLERVKLFLYDVSHDATQHNVAWMEKNLSIVGVRSLSVRKNLQGRNIAKPLDTSATFRKTGSSTYTLYVTTDNYDIFDVSSALLRLLLLRPKPQQTIVLMTLLETNLYKLQSRGYNVERILRQRAAEARIADEQRRRQLEDEQIRMREHKLVEQNAKLQLIEKGEDQASMPGVFPQTPDRKQNQSLRHDQTNETDSLDQGLGGFLSNLTRSFGGQGRRPQPQIDEAAKPIVPPPPYSQDDSKDALPSPESIINPGDLQKTLRLAIKASQPHNSESVVSQPLVSNVNDIRSFCDAKPAQNVSLAAETDSGTKIFLSNIVDKKSFIREHKNALDQFASVLHTSATPFALSRANVHIFHDESSTIAFNSNRALFFNFRFFQQLHFSSVSRGDYNEAVVYWFVVACHELAHNIVPDHSAAHSYYTWVDSSLNMMSTLKSLQGKLYG